MKNVILKNAEEIRRLHARIDETVRHRDENAEKLKEWQLACDDFHRNYNQLAFPGGLEGAYERILAGDQMAMEAAICFLECRPYFFRSGYMYKDLLRKTKKAPLGNEQRERFEAIKKKYTAYLKRRKH